MPVGPTDPGEVIRVRMLANWCSSQELCELFNAMTADGSDHFKLSGFQVRVTRQTLAALKVPLTSATDQPTLICNRNAE